MHSAPPSFSRALVPGDRGDPRKAGAPAALAFPAHLFPPAGSRPWVLRGRYREPADTAGNRSPDLVAWRVPRGLFFVVTRRTSIVSAVSAAAPTPYPLEGGANVYNGDAVVFQGSASADTGPEWLDETALDHDCFIVFAPDSLVKIRASVTTTNAAAVTMYSSLIGYLTSQDMTYALPR